MPVPGGYIMGGELRADLGALPAPGGSVLRIAGTKIRKFNGATWDQVATVVDAPKNFLTVLANGHQFYVSDAIWDVTGELYHSPDGITFTKVFAADVGTNRCVRGFDIAADGTAWLVFSADQQVTDGHNDRPMEIWSSPYGDGVNWTKKYTEPSGWTGFGWSNANHYTHVAASSLSADKLDANNIVLSGAGSLNVIIDSVRSIDGGASWTTVINPTTDFPRGIGVGDTLMFVNNQRLLFFHSQGTAARIWYSDDFGVTWTMSASGLGTVGRQLAMYDPVMGDNLALLSDTTGLSHLYLSSDNGVTWTDTALGALNSAMLAIAYDFANDTVYVGSAAGHKVFKITDVTGTPVITEITSDLAAADNVDGTSFNWMALTLAGGAIAAHIADRTAIEFGEAAIILAGTNIVNPVYYISDADPNNWKRCIGAPVRDDGTWICRDTFPGTYVFGFHDENIYLGDVVAGVMTATLAAASLDPGDKANHAIWIGEMWGSQFAGCYLVAADGGLYQTWDRFATIEKIRPATGFPAWVGKAKMVAMSEPE